MAWLYVVATLAGWGLGLLNCGWPRGPRVAQLSDVLNWYIEHDHPPPLLGPDGVDYERMDTWPEWDLAAEDKVLYTWDYICEKPDRYTCG